MRFWFSWWHNLILFSQQYPPRFIELLMLFLAMGLLLAWGRTDQWPYLVLSLSYVIGSSLSILIREASLENAQPTLTQITAVTLIIVSVYSFAELAYYF